MRLTPLDIRKQEFKRGMRGLDADEVYAFLATIADEYEAVLNDNKALRERLLELDDKVQEYRNMEKTLRDTLLTAERITVDAKDTARREAELIIKQAELDADKGVRDIKANATRLRQEIKSLKSQRESYVSRMKMLVESHLKFIESAEQDFDYDEQLLDLGERTTTDKAESATPPTPQTRSEGDTRSAAAVAPGGAIGERPAQVDKPVTETPTPTPNREVEQKSAPTPPSTTARAEESGGTQTITQPSASDRLNELLDRVVQQQNTVQSEAAVSTPEKTAPQTDDPVLEAPTEPIEPTRPAVETISPGEGPDNSGEKPRAEWSLERLKHDILSRRPNPDEAD